MKEKKIETYEEYWEESKKMDKLIEKQRFLGKTILVLGIIIFICFMFLLSQNVI